MADYEDLVEILDSRQYDGCNRKEALARVSRVLVESDYTPEVAGGIEGGDVDYVVRYDIDGGGESDLKVLMNVEDSSVEDMRFELE